MNRRKFLESLGLAGAGAAGATALGQMTTDAAEPNAETELYLPMVTNGAADHFSGLIVAANNAPEPEKNGAHLICPGIDDQVTINQAIAQLGESGGLVRLTAGTYNCSGAVRLGRRISLLGVGRATILKATGSWSAYDGSQYGAIIEPADGGTDKTLVGFLALDGNRWEGGDTLGIYYNITSKDAFDEGPDAGHYFTDLYIYRTKRHGFHIKGTNMRATKVTRIRVYNVGAEGETEAHGFFIDSPDGMFSQIETGSSSGYGILVEGANNHFTNCKAWFSDLNGWHISSVRGVYSACVAQDNAGHGFYIGSGPNSLTSCHADSNSWESAAPAATHDGFHIPWGGRIQLIGCSSYDKDEGGRGNWQRYGFYVGGSAEHIQIFGTVKDNATAGTGGNGIESLANTIMVNG